MTVDNPTTKSLAQCVADAKTVSQQISGRLADATIMSREDASNLHRDVRYAIEVLQHLEKLLARHAAVDLGGPAKLEAKPGMDRELDAKLYAAILHTITTLHFERLHTDQRAHLADAIVRAIEARKIV